MRYKKGDIVHVKYFGAKGCDPEQRMRETVFICQKDDTNFYQAEDAITEKSAMVYGNVYKTSFFELMKKLPKPENYIFDCIIEEMITYYRENNDNRRTAQ
jgi:hypothetical protein